jgi:UDP-glucose 4-epimerase
VAGADPAGRTGQSTANATHLIKVAVQAALGERSYVEVYGSDYQTRDGTCLRDYIHVADLVSAHVAALEYLRNGGQCDCRGLLAGWRMVLLLLQKGVCETVGEWL